MAADLVMNDPSKGTMLPGKGMTRAMRGTPAIVERALIRERQHEGIALAWQRDAHRGRKKSLNEADCRTETARRGGRAKGPDRP